MEREKERERLVEWGLFVYVMELLHLVLLLVSFPNLNINLNIYSI